MQAVGVSVPTIERGPIDFVIPNPPPAVNRCLHGQDLCMDVIERVNCTHLTERLRTYFGTPPSIIPKKKPCQYCGDHEIDEINAIKHFFACKESPIRTFEIECPSCSNMIVHDKIKHHLQHDCKEIKCIACKSHSGTIASNRCLRNHIANVDLQSTFITKRISSFIAFLKSNLQA
jgi:hypothetical protein